MMDKPIPVPSPLALVVKNGVNNLLGHDVPRIADGESQIGAGLRFRETDSRISIDIYYNIGAVLSTKMKAAMDLKVHANLMKTVYRSMVCSCSFPESVDPGGSFIRDDFEVAGDGEDTGCLLEDLTDACLRDWI
jgi:hypothetical protein